MTSDTPLSFPEYSKFMKLLNENGYILDFSNDDFSALTLDLTGVDLLDKYKASKAKSLKAFLREYPRSRSLPVLTELMKEWESSRRANASIEDSLLAEECQRQLQNLKNNLANNEAGDRLKSAGFSSEYLENQRRIMLENISTHPTASIGTAKELIESCCATILEKRGAEYEKTDNLPKLVDRTQTALSINPRNVTPNAHAGKTIRALLGSLANVAQRLAELRNLYGTGHGKSASYKELEKRHAQLAVGASLALVEYLWSTHIAS